jgi:branched-chain amino acid transport system ATP-binding protein
MIRIEDLTVQFGGVRPLDGLSAELVAPIVGLVGPNGAGKTTLLNVLSGFVRPAAGLIEVDGCALLPLSPTARVRFGLRRTFQTEQVVEDLTVRDNVLALADHVRDGIVDVDRAIAFVGLDDVADLPGAALDQCQRRLVEIAKALVGRPRLILMDEPGAGLTEAETGHLRRVILDIPAAFGAQVVLIDHDVALIAATCEETLVLDFGKRLALGPTRAALDDPAVRQAYLGS